MTDAEKAMESHRNLDRHMGKDKETITLVACGDIGLYGDLEKKLIQKGPLAILGDTTEVFKGATLVFGNLEESN